MDPTLLSQLMLAYGVDPKETSGDFLSSVTNAIALNQMPKIIAGGESLLTDATYEDALKRAYEARQQIRERSPMASFLGDITGGTINPLNRVGQATALGRVATGAAQAGINQLGEQGAGVEDAGASTAFAAGLMAALEAVPVVGNQVGNFAKWTDETALGVRRTASRKATKEVADKSIVRKGYEEFQNLLKEGKASPEQLENYNAIFRQPSTRAGIAKDVAKAEIKKITAEQEKLVAEASEKIKPLLMKRGEQATSVIVGPGSAYNDFIEKASAAKSAGGKLDTSSADRVVEFKNAYTDHLKELQGKFQKSLANEGKNPITLADLLQQKKIINAKGLYDETKDGIKSAAATAAILDLNENIAKNLTTFAEKGILEPKLATKYAELGTKDRNLIAFKEAIELSRTGANDLASATDISKTVQTGGLYAIALNQVLGVPYIPAAIAGGTLASSAGMGALGKVISKANTAASEVANMSSPFAKSTITTQTPLRELGVEEEQMSTPTNIPEARVIPDEEFANKFLGAFGEAPQQAQPQGSFADKFLSEFAGVPNTATPLASPQGDLPSQQSQAGQGVALSGVSAPVTAERLAPFYAALGLTESSLNPTAKNPNSSAKGLFQLIDSTAGNLGVTDPYDANQQRAAIEALTQENINRFQTDDPYALHAAHYLGAPTLAAWQGNTLTPEQLPNVNSYLSQALPAFQKNYQLATDPVQGNNIINELYKLYS